MEKTTPIYTAKSNTDFFLKLLAYIVFVCACENLSNFLVRPHIAPYLNTNPLLIFIEPLSKLLFWLLPSYLYLRYVEHEDPIAYLKLKANPGRSILWGALVALLIVGLILVDKYLILRNPFGLHTLQPDDWLNVVLLVGFMEEIPFRGVVFQKLHERLSFWWAAILSSLIFLELHLVYWLSLGKPVSYLLSGTPSILLFAIISCLLLKRTGSLWGSIVWHSIYDFATLLFA